MGNTISQFKDHFKSLLPGGSAGLSPEQINVSTHLKLSILTTVAWCYIGYKYIPITLPELPTVTDRLVFTLQWQLPSVSMMVLGINEVGSLRWRTSAINPLNECEEQDKFQIYKNFLSNTTEQLIINGASQLMLTTFLNESQMKIIPVVSSLFVVGRLLFLGGYLSSKQTNRSFGFGVTLVPTMGMVGYCWFQFVRRFIY